MICFPERAAAVCIYTGKAGAGRARLRTVPPAACFRRASLFHWPASSPPATPFRQASCCTQAKNLCLLAH